MKHFILFHLQFIEVLVKSMKDFMKANEWGKARYVVRFFANLVSCHVLDVSSLLALYENFAAVHMEPEIPQVRSDWFIHAILSSLPWVSQRYTIFTLDCK